MNGLTAGLVLVGGLLLGFLVGRRTGFFSPSSVYIWFMDLDLALFTYIAFAHLDKSNFTFTAMPWPPFDTVVLPTVLMYAVLIVAGWLSAWNLDKATAPAAAAPKVRLVIPAFVRRNLSLLMVAFFIVVFWMEVYHFWDMDKSVFWQNSRYLSIANPTTAGINTLAGRLIHFALPPLGLVLASAGTFFWVRQRRHTAALFFILCIYPFLLALAENSRWAPLYVACVLAIIIFFESIKKYILTVIIGGVAGFLLFLKVLIGRNTPYQGLGGTAQIFALVFSEFRFWPWLISFFLNILQGAQSVANAF